MSQTPIVAVMVHVSDVSEALAWYGLAFRGASRRRIAAPDFEFLQVEDVQLEFVPADSKVLSGPSGSVVYWRVAQFEEALDHFQSIGAKLYRGPMKIEANQFMCQVQDPWGNCIGLRGPSASGLQPE
jgi:predicted enzyme related to lactoylglutathione lyase